MPRDSGGNCLRLVRRADPCFGKRDVAPRIVLRPVRSGRRPVQSQLIGRKPKWEEQKSQRQQPSSQTHACALKPSIWTDTIPERPYHALQCNETKNPPSFPGGLARPSLVLQVELAGTDTNASIIFRAVASVVPPLRGVRLSHHEASWPGTAPLARRAFSFPQSKGRPEAALLPINATSILGC